MEEGRKILVLGGARSGKSRFALERAALMGGRRLYVATARPVDQEMEERIEAHRRERGDGWDVVEEPLSIEDVIGRSQGYEVILIDCLTLWLSNVMEDFNDPCREEAILARVDGLVEAVRRAIPSILVVSNEVGLGIVPDSRLGRAFRDMAGRLNQRMAEVAHEVFFLVSGIPMRLK